MNTIEMLKELVENGGMFTLSSDNNRYVTKTNNGGIVSVSKETGISEVVVLYWQFFTGTTWKPYVKPVDWSKVPIDTKVICKQRDSLKWWNRYFAGVENGKPCTWEWGCTSWTSDKTNSQWEEVKLADATE